MIQRPLRFGALFAGYGGLEIGVQSVLGGELAWYSEYEPPTERRRRPSQAAARIMAHHHPGVPNLGDITQIDWRAVPPVDVLTGGSPCQDVSTSGKRVGMRAGTRSGLWASMCDAIEILRPQLVVWENVQGVLSSEADSAMEPCPGCVGDGGDGPVLRALGRVLGDLAGLGYDAWWCGLRAADVGAPHSRYRVFVFATPADTEDVGHERGRGTWPGRTGPENGGDAPADTEDRRQQYWDGGGPAAQRSRAPRLTAAPADTEGHSLRVRDGDGRAPADTDDAEPTAWGPYAPAIDRWAAVLGRPAPPPTELGPKGAPRLSPRFVEWLMGLPAGHVTDVPGISLNDQLKALGNGVVPAQAAAATRRWLNHYTND